MTIEEEDGILAERLSYARLSSVSSAADDDKVQTFPKILAV